MTNLEKILDATLGRTLEIKDLSTEKLQELQGKIIDEINKRGVIYETLKDGRIIITELKDFKYYDSDEKQ